MKITNKNKGYCGTNHTSNVSRSFSNENNKQYGICRKIEHTIVKNSKEVMSRRDGAYRRCTDYVFYV
jgi:hypothetical protein